MSGGENTLFSIWLFVQYSDAKSGGQALLSCNECLFVASGYWQARWSGDHAAFVALNLAIDSFDGFAAVSTFLNIVSVRMQSLVISNGFNFCIVIYFPEARNLGLEIIRGSPSRRGKRRRESKPEGHLLLPLMCPLIQKYDIVLLLSYKRRDQCTLFDYRLS